MSAQRQFAQITSVAPATGPRAALGRAVVLGGSIAGLMAARVLSEHADEVVIVEPDDLVALDVPGAPPVPRPGVPQGGHVHALLPAGQAQLARWFPGFTEDAVRAGAPVRPHASRFVFYLDGARRPPADPGVQAESLSSSRPFLEALIRHRVLALPAVTTRTGRAAGLLIEGGRVTGVRLTGGGTLDADFVVDATGRSSRLGDWVAAHGFPKPATQRMGIALTYATALFHRPPEPDVWGTIAVTTPAPGRPARQGGFTPIEGGRWTMLIAGYGDDRPGRDREDYRRRCERDFPPEFAHVVNTAGWASDVATYHQADSRRRDFTGLERFPARLVAAGDALASFNPAYGQGMTSALLHASCLSRYLRGRPDLDRPARTYFAETRVVVDAAWQTSTAADLALPHVDGPYPRGYRLRRWAGGLISAAAAHDPVVNRGLSRVTTMIDHPAALSRPGLLLRAARHALRDRQVRARSS
ncbi:FAD-dependent oxidoreductase [Catenuloplanes indicus]|uniref:2-polyprenyl-6-methoxyphenol hydroxylase-like FAD-dependent oxidoreductase n=1 Tax=Catenuloplanes indicus TaxID=137267 RepID=A0AAE4B294_9ACTN|nr:FAD-dependent oxidoreductase [Catenuloplanes indicus]MDQ0371417.1 2-polyprenyl-6-methoxyphenol hydroxylase-like FAD-dependent oxidoreductase [Catenuloplanes indicus]